MTVASLNIQVNVVVDFGLLSFSRKIYRIAIMKPC